MSTRVGNGGIFSEERPSGCVWKSAGERRDIAELKKKRNIKGQMQRNLDNSSFVEKPL